MPPSPSSSQPSEPEEDLVLFLQGRVVTDDGSSLPSDASIQCVCKDSVLQQVYATPHGDFSMQLGSRAGSFLDATAGGPVQYGAPSKAPVTGIPRGELTSCELRTSASGFHPRDVMLAGLTALGGTIDVGAVVVQRAIKVEGATLNAAPYKAPKEARTAYEKGLASEKNGKLADACEYFEKAVQIYPGYAHAWFQLGSVLQKEDQKDAARAAYTRATAIDTRFLLPYLSLATLAYQAEDWPEVLNLTARIFDLDPLNHANITGYIVDLDPSNCAEAYFYNAMANYRLNHIDDAEKSALKAEQRADLPTRFPQVHLLLADIFVLKKSYANAISEMQAYLELAPYAKDADQVRKHLAKLEKLNGSVLPSEKPL